MGKKEIIDFCKSHVWTLLSALFCLGALVYFVHEYTGGSQKTRARDFIAAKTLFERVYAQESLSKESLEDACTLLEKNPQLASQYQGILSIALAQSGFTDISEQHIKEHLQRLSFSSPLHQEFISIGFLISDNRKEIALQKSLELEQKLENSDSYSRLRDFNLLRIAFLAEECHQSTLSLSSLQKLAQSPFFEDMQQLFSAHSFSLNDFFH